MIELLSLTATGSLIAAVLWGAFLLFASKYLIGYRVSLRDVYCICFRRRPIKMRQHTVGIREGTPSIQITRSVVVAISTGGDFIMASFGIETTGANTSVSFEKLP